MLKGLAITPPVLGRISIGKVIEKNGKRLPEKDDQFTITSQVQGKDGWLLHPLNEELRQGKDDKLRSIPVRLLFNEPELNFRADYTLFDRQSGRPVCVGNGETCKRVTQDGMQSLPCPSPDACPLAKGGACKPYGRLNVVIGDEDPHHDVIERAHTDEIQRVLQFRGEVAIRHAGLRVTRRVVVHQDQGGGVVLQGELHNLPGIHAGAIESPPEQLLERNHPVSAVEHEQGEHFVLIISQQRLQVTEHLLRRR